MGPEKSAESHKPVDLLWLTAAIPFLLLVGFTVQGSVEIRSAPEHDIEVLVDGKPTQSSTTGVHRTGLMLIGPHQVTIRQGGQPERQMTAFVWLSQRVVVQDASSTSEVEPIASPEVVSRRSIVESSAPPAATEPQSPIHSFAGAVLELRLFNIDDDAAATINGAQVLSAGYQHDTGFVNVTGRCNQGVNQVGFQLDNRNSGYTWGFEIRVDGRVVWREEEGVAGSRGARGDEHRFGRVHEQSVSFVLNAPAEANSPPDVLSATAASVELFQDRDFGGSSQRLGAGHWNAENLGIGARQLSSIKIPPGWRVIAFSELGFTGESRVYTEDAEFVGWDFNDRTSSILIQSGPEARQPLPDEVANRMGPWVTIFDDRGFGGTKQTLNVGRYGPKELSLGDNQLSSLKVPSGWRVTLYDGESLDGETRIYSQDVEFVGWDFNEKTSSILVEKPGH